MSFKPPQPFRTRLEGGINLTGLPTSYGINVDRLPTLRLVVEQIPMIQLAIERIPKVQLSVDPVEIRLTQFPSIRGHLPADFCVGLSVLGLDLATIRLCGEAQIITEPYRPNPCEVCAPQLRPVPGSVGVAREADPDDERSPTDASPAHDPVG